MQRRPVFNEPQPRLNPSGDSADSPLEPSSDHDSERDSPKLSSVGFFSAPDYLEGCYKPLVCASLVRNTPPPKPNFNSPCDADTKSLYDVAIGQTNSDIRTLSHEIVNVQRVISMVKDLEESVIKRRDGYRHYLSAFRRIKMDVWVRVAELVVCEMMGDPWVLMSVCRAWRAAALSAKRIWCSFIIDTSYTDNQRNVQGQEIICNHKQLLFHLSRSGNLPLTIGITKCDDPSMASLLSLHGSRWETLLYHDNLKDEVENLLFCYSYPSDTPTFKTFAIDGYEQGEGRLMSRWLREAQPPELRLSGYDLTQLTWFPWWPHLTNLSIKSPPFHSDRVRDLQQRAITKILQGTRQFLLVLSLQDFQLNTTYLLEQIEPPQTIDPTILTRTRKLEFPRLQKLTIKQVRNWEYLHFPTVRSFSLDIQPSLWDTGPITTPTMADFPSLTELDFTPDPEWKYYGFLTAPNLETLSLHNPDQTSPARGRAIWNADSDGEEIEPLLLLQPRVLHLHGIHQSAQFLAHNLMQLTDLLELYIHKSFASVTMFQTLFSRGKGQRKMHLPKLRVLVVELYDDVTFFRKNSDPRARYTEIFRDIARARKRVDENGVGLRVFRVVWTEGFGGGETDFLNED